MLKRCETGEVPEGTAKVARAAFPKGNTYMGMRDELGTLYEDGDFAELFPTRGQPAESPWRLALVVVMQFAEGLTDRQAADAVRGRIDWKYALGLELSDPGFDFSVLSEFRSRLLAGGGEEKLLNVMLERFVERQLLKRHGRQRTDSTHVLAAVRNLNRLEVAGETLRQALNRLALEAGPWLKDQVGGEWFERYGQRLEDYRLPKSETQRQAMAETIGRDGYQLLRAVYSESAPSGLRALTEVETLRAVWVQSYYLEGDQVHWRVSGNLPPSALMISSPYDIEARYATKRERSWVGFKSHLTETCEADHPNLITQVETTLATAEDIKALASIQEDLVAQGRAPAQQVVDTGYVSAQTLVDSGKRDIDLLGPTMADTSWQGRDRKGFDQSHFLIDWQAEQVRCPQGHLSQTWKPGNDRGKAVVNVKFPAQTCLICPCRHLCTRSRQGGRELTFPRQEQYLALQAARQRQVGVGFKGEYAIRAGIEGTISQAAHARDMRQARYIGLDRTHLQNLATAAAINLTRAVDWLFGTPRARTRKSAFASLAA